MLIVDDGAGNPCRIDTPTSAVDVAPTILDFLGVACDGADGRPLLSA